MKESRRKGVATILTPSHARAVVRLHLRRWTGAYAGWVLSSENGNPGSRRRQPDRKATERCAIARACRALRSRRPHARIETGCPLGPREPRGPVAARRKAAGRVEKAMSDKSTMHGSGESYSGVVPAKLPNTSGRPQAEVVEGRPLAKQNTEQSNQCRTQRWERGSNGLGRVRQVAKKDGKAQFRALLHHVTVDLLRDSY